MATLKVDTITSADTPTVSITDGASISGVTTFSSDINIADKIVHTGDTDTAIRFPGADTITWETGGSERMRLSSAGRLMIGSDVSGHGNADDLTITTAGGSIGHAGMTIRSGTSSDGNIFFADATSGSGETIGAIKYSHSDNSLRFTTNGSERMRIATSGSVGIGTDTTASSCKLQVVEPDSTECYIQVANQTTGYDGNSGLLVGYNGSEVAKIMNLENTAMDIGTNGNNRISIANDGHVTLSNAISFNAETGTANRLDDYEEGNITWHLRKSDATSTGNDNGSVVKYTKVGRMVTISGRIRTDSTGGTSNVFFYMDGTLPFTPVTPGTAVIGHLRSMDIHDGTLTASIAWGENNSTIYIYSPDVQSDYSPSSNNVGATNQTNLVATFSFSYIAS